MENYAPKICCDLGTCHEQAGNRNEPVKHARIFWKNDLSTTSLSQSLSYFNILSVFLFVTSLQ